MEIVRIPLTFGLPPGLIWLELRDITRVLAPFRRHFQKGTPEGMPAKQLRQQNHTLQIGVVDPHAAWCKDHRRTAIRHLEKIAYEPITSLVNVTQ